MSRRSGRPSRGEGPAITREELVLLAARAIGRDGLARTSMRGIAREAGVSLSTVQNHFRTKDLLWKAVIDGLVERERDRPREVGDVPTWVRAVVATRLGAAVRWPGLPGRLLVDAAAENEELLGYLVEQLRPVRAAGEARLALATELGLVRPAQPAALTALLGVALPLLSSAQGAMQELAGVDLNDEEERAALARGVADILLYGLLPRASEPTAKEQEPGRS